MDRPRAWRLQGIDLSVEPLLRVGGASIDPRSREATFAGGTERLQPQNLKVLILLARRKGQVVTRTELIDLCWDGRIVGEDVINHSISVLRAFAERATGFAIETVPKAGYRLAERGVSRRPLAKYFPAIALAVAGLAILALLWLKPAEQQGKPPVPTVALLPFAAPAGDPVAAEVARAARVSLSHMLAEGGFPLVLVDSAGAPSKAADFQISGDIARESGAMVATVRMEEGRRHVVIFTHRFEEPASKAASLPDQIGASVAANLSWNAALMILDRRHPTDPRITGELLRQMSITVEGGDILQAYEISRRTVEKAPNSAIAQVALAFNSGFALEDLPREQRAAAVAIGRRASIRAEKLAPEFGDVYIPWCFLHSYARLAECEARVRKGIAADPDAPFTEGFLSMLLSDVGRIDEALEFARLSIANDRYKTSKLSRIIRALEAAGQTAEAEQIYAQAIRWWPHNGRIYMGRWRGLVERGDFAAIDRFAKSTQAAPRIAPDVIAAVRTGDGGQAIRLCKDSEGQEDLAMLCLIALSDLGEMDAAFALADQLYSPWVAQDPAEEERLWLDNPGRHPLGLLSGPSATSLRRDPRYIGLVRQVGVLRYWQTVKMPDFCRPPGEAVCSQIKKQP